MACVLVPAAEAVLTTAAEKILAAKEEKHPAEFRANFSRKLKWLNRLLWGGSGLLAFEHVWGIMLVVSSKLEKRAELPASE